MKKLLLPAACLLSLSVALATAPTMTPVLATYMATTAKPAALTDYVGKYKMNGLPFDYITISLKEGKLVIVAGDQQGELTPMAEADKFDANGQATLKFIRDAAQKVTGVTLEAQGTQFEGKKADMVTMADYVGKYKMEGLPFDYLTVTEKDGKLTADTGSQNGELIALPEADKFDASGQATLKFTRDAAQKVTGVTLEAQGTQYTGKKES